MGQNTHMTLTSTKTTVQADSKNTLSELTKTAGHVFNETGKALGSANQALELFNLKMEKTRHLKSEIISLKTEKSKPNVNLKYARSSEEKSIYLAEISEIDTKIQRVKDQILDVEKQCELDQL